MLCEMTGCFDEATYTADFFEAKELLEICESCAEYWREHQEETPKITAWKVAQND